jgi:hypothetical protein
MAGCGAVSSYTVTGVVIAVDQPTQGDIEGFTLRAVSGQTLMFEIGVLDMDHDGDDLPPAQLAVYMRTGESIRVTFQLVQGVMVTTELENGSAGASPD